jgi:hypothetical protein
MDYTNLRPKEDVDQNGLIFAISSLYAIFLKLQDKRKQKGKRFPLPMLLVLMVLANLGAKTSRVGWPNRLSTAKRS